MEAKILLFLDNMFKMTPPATVTKKIVYFSLPYFERNSENLKKEVIFLLQNYFTNIFKIILVDPFKIRISFSYNHRQAIGMRTSLVYKYSSAQCASCYVGSIIHNLNTKVAKHAGRSYSTDNIIAHPSHSAVKLHSESYDVTINRSNFSIYKASVITQIYAFLNLYIFINSSQVLMRCRQHIRNYRKLDNILYAFYIYCSQYVLMQVYS